MPLKYLLFSLLFFFTTMLYAQNDTLCQQIASQSVKWMQKGESNKLFYYFTEKVASKLSLETTKKLWPQIVSQYGNFKNIDTIIDVYHKPFLLVDCILDFENGKLRYRLTFNQENKISGIFFSPYQQQNPGAYEPQNTAFYSEKKLEFVNDKIHFPALLCMPKNRPAVAVAVLVHGSGPNDMNESIGPNKIFMQLAHQLAKQGIATLRYQKRSYLIAHHKAADLYPHDIQHIVVNDALAAINTLAKTPALESTPIFIVGHSLGAFLAPLIASKTDKIAGIVLMAANASPLEDVIVDQYNYLYARNGYTKVEKQEIKKIKRQAMNVKSLEKDLKKGKKKTLLLTSDTSFWLSLSKYNPIKVANSLTVPMLIIRGSRDYQISEKEFRLWGKGLRKPHHTYDSILNKDTLFFKSVLPITFVSYNGLNHLFIKGTAKSYPEEYNHRGNVSAIVVSDMANWMKSVLK